MINPKLSAVDGLGRVAPQPAFLLRIPFPDPDGIEAAFADREYQDIVGLRDSGFGDLSIYIAES